MSNCKLGALFGLLLAPSPQKPLQEVEQEERACNNLFEFFFKTRHRLLYFNIQSSSCQTADEEYAYDYILHLHSALECCWKLFLHELANL